MKTLIVEDEAIARDQLMRLLKNNFPDVEVVSATDSVSSTIEWLAENPQVDVIFMDVELADGECFEIFRQVQVNAQVVMTTAYNSYAIKAFEAGSVDYLLKPISLQALERAVNRCRKTLNMSSGAAAGGASGVQSTDIQKILSAIEELNVKKKYKERLVVQVGNQIIPVAISEVAYFFSEDKVNYLALHSGSRFLVDETMDGLEACLDPESFFRISRGCIVSRKAVQKVSKYISGRLMISLKPEPPFSVTVARTRVNDFYSWLS